MTAIVTITPNPAVDLSTTVERIVPVHKLRGTSQRRDPGGGGINVARVVMRLGGEVRAIYPAGGAMGALLRRRRRSQRASSEKKCFAIQQLAMRAAPAMIAIRVGVSNFMGLYLAHKPTL